MTTDDFDYLSVLNLGSNVGNGSNFYDLFISTYNGNIVNINFFPCTRRHQMRLDLVSSDLYGTTKYVGTLCQLNNIIDTYSIRQGDFIAYCSAQDAEQLLTVPDAIKQSSMNPVNQVKQQLINALKNQSNDPNRRNYSRTADKLPPTVLPANSPQIFVSNNKIRIAPDLFTTPTSVPAQPTTVPGPLNNIPTNTTSNSTSIEKVLVNRYIQQINSN